MGADEQQILLGVLNEVQRDYAATQRQIAGNLDIALGLANAYLKRCIKKGLVKVAQAPARRYAYYLTPLGFAEKAALTASYLSQSFDFFRVARSQCRDVLAECSRNGWRRIALAGASELAEIMALCAAGSDVALVGVIGAAERGSHPATLPMVASVAELPPFDGMVVTALDGAQAIYDALAAELGADRLLVPPLLTVVTSPYPVPV
jgi:DNA-binding MarR family transcriptional regulator